MGEYSVFSYVAVYIKYKCYRVSSGRADLSKSLKGENETILPGNTWRQLEEERTGYEI